MRRLLPLAVLTLVACGAGGETAGSGSTPEPTPPAAAAPHRPVGITYGAGHAAAHAGHSLRGGALSAGALSASSTEHRMHAATLR